MIWLKRPAKTVQEDIREAEPVMREILARIEENGEDAARAVIFAFFMLLVLLPIACIPTVSTAMLPDIYK